MSPETSSPADIRRALDGIVDGCSAGPCGCMGPQGDEPVCPCAMRNVIRWRGRWIQFTPIDSGVPKGFLDDLTPGIREYDVILTSFGDKKINVIREVRAITGISLTEAKKLVETAPKSVMEGMSLNMATRFKRQIEDAGGTVELR
jgi:hypothetical protein